MLPTTAKAGGAPMVPTSSWKSEIWKLLERGTKALGESEAKRVARQEASSAPGDLLRLPMPEFSIFTPRVKKAETIAGLERNSPTAGQPVPGCAVTFELYRFLETNDIDIDELSSAAMIRLDTMDLDLLNMGYPKNKTGAAIQLEWYIRD
jgi:hypothetical protein